MGFEFNVKFNGTELFEMATNENAKEKFRAFALEQFDNKLKKEIDTVKDTLIYILNNNNYERYIKSLEEIEDKINERIKWCLKAKGVDSCLHCNRKEECISNNHSLLVMELKHHFTVLNDYAGNQENTDKNGEIKKI